VRTISSGQSLRIWALLGNGRGDDNQVLALAEALGLPFETKLLRYNQLRRLKPRLLGTSLCSLDPASRAIVADDPPDLVISVGYRSVPLERVIRQRSGGRTSVVHLGNPRISPDHFDLVVPTPEYPVPEASNVMRIPLTIQRPRDAAANAASTSAFLDNYPSPRRLLLLGGATLYWTLGKEDVAAAISAISSTAQGSGSLLVLGSPRTSEGVMCAARRELARSSIPAALVPTEGPPSYRAVLAAADVIFVTADSVSMVSEAVATGKPVGLVPIRRSSYGRLALTLMDRLRPGRQVHPRDLRYFWRELERGGCTGTVEYPRSGMAPDPTAAVVQRVRQLLSLPIRPTTADPDW
jgi:mitochondrial fission protein ELM1